MTQTRTAIVPETYVTNARVTLRREPWPTEDEAMIGPHPETAPRGLPIRDKRVTSTRQDKVLNDAVRKFG